jgi:hypothetical protein
VREALALSTNADAYRRYIAESRGEFTVAKDQNVRLRSGWFSDCSATYLAAGRPVVTQETGFSNTLPTGRGLFAFTDIEEATEAIESIDSDYEAHRKAASELAEEYFGHDVVLTRLLADLGLPSSLRTSRPADESGTGADATGTGLGGLPPRKRMREKRGRARKLPIAWTPGRGARSSSRSITAHRSRAGAWTPC